MLVTIRRAQGRKIKAHTRTLCFVRFTPIMYLQSYRCPKHTHAHCDAGDSLESIRQEK